MTRMAQTPQLFSFAAATSPEVREVRPADRLERNARMRFAVAQALTHGRIRFDLQPVVRASRRDFPVFHELLARMVLPNGTVVPAGGFLPFVEDGPLGRAIDRLALSRALEMLAARPALRLAVNMSLLSMGDQDYLETLSNAAARDPGVVGRLIIEITETTAIRDVGTTVAFMDFGRSLGVAFAIDDFGAGATGFRHFRDFRFDMVKIDGAFVEGVAGSPDCQVLIECLMAAARHFEMFVVAERVETAADAEWLERVGVDCLQGWLIGKPQPEIIEPGWRGGAVAAAG